MGAEVQSKMYLPEYDSIRDLCQSTGSGGWVLNFENRNLKSEQYGVTFPFRPLTDEYVGCYKEQLRQTILKHESIFRHQVSELHRLYKVQRDMMNEVKRKEVDKYLLQLGSSQKSCLIPVGFLSEVDIKSGQTPNLPCDRPSASGGNGIRSRFDSSKDTKELSCGPGSSGLLDCESLQLKHDTLQKSSFDLELPANDLINNEDIGSRTKNHPLNWNFDITREKDGNLPICCGLFSGSNGDALSSNVCLRSTHGLTNLNESFLPGKPSGSASVNILGTTTCPRDAIQRQDISVTSYSGFQCLSNEVCLDPDKGKDKITGHRNLHSEAEYNQKGWPSTHDELPKTHENLKFTRSEQKRTEPHSKRKLFGVDISDSDASAVASHTLGPSPGFQFEATNSESSHISSRRNLPGSYNWNLITAQENPYSNAFASKSSKTLMPVPISVGRKFLVDSSSGSVLDFRSEFSYQNDLSVGSQLDLKKARTCQPLVGFDHACCISDNSSASEHHPRNNTEVLGSVVDANSAKDMNTVAIAPNVHQMNLDFLQNHSQQSINSTEMTKNFVQDALSVTHVHKAEHMKNEVVALDGMKILGYPICQKSTSQDLLSHNSPSTIGSNFEKVWSLDTDLNRDPILSKSQERPKVERSIVEKEMVNHSAGQKHHIDLNLCASEDEDQLTLSCLETNLGIAGERDLISPLITETKSFADRELEFVESRLKETYNSSGDESMEPLEGLVKVAASALVAISSSKMPHHDNLNCEQLEASPSNLLQWFAEIISSYKGDIEDEVSISLFNDFACEEDSMPKGLDHFEFMTLKLTETKVEECFTNNPQVLEISEHEEKPLPRRPRRSQARRGRQLKDFQRDVLPGISILSRNEVNDDLQIIEGMVIAAGGTLQSRLLQRNTTTITFRRGRRHSGAATNARTSPAARLSKTQKPKCREPGLVEISLAGWGNRTRRLPRQRCSISNIRSSK